MVGREEVGFGSIVSRSEGWKDGPRGRGVGGAGPLSLKSIIFSFTATVGTVQREIRQ